MRLGAIVCTHPPKNGVLLHLLSALLTQHNYCRVHKTDFSDAIMVDKNLPQLVTGSPLRTRNEITKVKIYFKKLLVLVTT